MFQIPTPPYLVFWEKFLLVLLFERNKVYKGNDTKAMFVLCWICVLYYFRVFNRRLISRTQVVRSPVQIIKVKEACEIARKVLDEVKEIVKPGVTTDDLDNFDQE